MDNTSDNLASEPATSAEAPSAEPIKTGKALRAGFWENVFGTFAHINSSLKVESKRLRASDYISVIALPVSACILAWCCASPSGMATRPYFVLIFNIATLYFIFARVGIIRTLNTRQTHLIWLIICATFILGTCFALLFYDFLRLLEMPPANN